MNKEKLSEQEVNNILMNTMPCIREDRLTEWINYLESNSKDASGINRIYLTANILLTIEKGCGSDEALFKLNDVVNDSKSKMGELEIYSCMDFAWTVSTRPSAILRWYGLDSAIYQEEPLEAASYPSKK